MGEARTSARIGVLVPFTNTNLESDMALMAPEGVSFHYMRLGGYDLDEIPDSEQMAKLGASDLDEPIKLLCGVNPDVIMYGCTSATLALGTSFDLELAEIIKKKGSCETVTAAGALVFALRSLNIKRIAFASPYVPQLNNEAIQFLSEYQISTVSCAEVEGALDNFEQGALSPQEVMELGKAADNSDAEAIVLSCTDMRAVEAIEKLERIAKKPVITSNQAMLFQALSWLPQIVPSFGFGTLFDGVKPSNDAMGKVL